MAGIPSGVSFTSTDTTGPTYGSISARDGFLAIGELAQDQRVPYLAYEDATADPDLEWGVGYRDASSNFEVDTVTATRKSGTVVRLSQGGSPTAITRTGTTVYEILSHEDSVIHPWTGKATITDTDTYVIIETPPEGYDLEVYFREVGSNDDQSFIKAQISTDDESTWKTTGTDYTYGAIGVVNNSTNLGQAAATGDSDWKILSATTATYRLGPASLGDFANLTVRFLNPRASNKTFWYSESAYLRNSGNNFCGMFTSGMFQTDVVVTDIRFYPSNATWDSGDVFYRYIYTGED